MNNFNKETLKKDSIETRNKIEARQLLDRIVIDGDAKQAICITPDGVETRIDLTALSLDQAYEAVSTRVPDGLGNVRPAQDKDINRIR